MQELEAARTSKLFAPDAQGRRSGQTAGTSGDARAETAVAPDDERPLGQVPPGRTDCQVASSQLSAAPSPFTLQADSIIPAALITGLSSDVPGQVVAQVTQNIRDSVTGTHLLVPQDSKLIGEYDADFATGQSRALLVWTRLILPDGRSVRLDKEPAAENSQRAARASTLKLPPNRLLGDYVGVTMHPRRALKSVKLLKLW